MVNFDRPAARCLLTTRLVTSNAHGDRNSRAGLTSSFGQDCSSTLCTLALLFSLTIGPSTTCCSGLFSGSNDCLLSGLLLISHLRIELDPS